MSGVEAAHSTPCTLADLHWMKGIWRTHAPTAESEERWAFGPDDRILGSSWLLHPKAGGGVLEISTIQDDKSAVTLRLRHFSADLGLAREDKDAPMVFIASRCEPALVVFDGQGSQTGEHMTYRRTGDRMSFIGDFLHDGKPIKATVEFEREGD